MKARNVDLPKCAECHKIIEGRPRRNKYYDPLCPACYLTEAVNIDHKINQANWCEHRDKCGAFDIDSKVCTGININYDYCGICKQFDNRKIKAFGEQRGQEKEGRKRS
jgi:hypothetical protein